MTHSAAIWAAIAPMVMAKLIPIPAMIGNDQGQDNEGVSAQTAKELIHYIRNRLSEQNQADETQYDEHHGNCIFLQNFTKIPFITHETHLLTL